MSGSWRCAIIAVIGCICLSVVASLVMSIIALIDVSALSPAATTLSTLSTTPSPTVAAIRSAQLGGAAAHAGRPLQRHALGSIRQSILKGAAQAVNIIESQQEQQPVVAAVKNDAVHFEQKREARPVLLANNAIDTKKTGVDLSDLPPLVEVPHKHKHKSENKGVPVKPIVVQSETTTKSTLSVKDKLRKKRQ